MDKDLAIHFAPMQGYTDHVYRKIHSSMFGGVDCYYTPFIRVEKGEPRHQDIRRLKESIGEATTLVPQVIFNSVDELRILTDAVKELGFCRVDLNLGCPYPMQTGKGRGASIIASKVLEQVGSIILSDNDLRYSVKMRLGMEDPSEWHNAMPILNSLSLVHITMHPRTAKQQYTGDISHEAFAGFVKMSANPVIWNGDIVQPSDIDILVSRYPSIKGVMIGRGLLRRPSLAVEWRTMQEWEIKDRFERILQMHSQLLDNYEATLCGQTQILQKIKPFWDYLKDEIGHKNFKAIHKATNLPRYKAAIHQLNDYLQNP